MKDSNAAPIQVRMTTALRAPTHSLAWCGAEAGVFKAQGIDVTFPVIETTGPEAVHGLARGEWDFCQTGTLPVVENFLNGGMHGCCFAMPCSTTISASRYGPG